MSVVMSIGQPLDGNRVEVNAKYNSGAYKKSFSIEKAKADEFMTNYKKTYNKISIIDTAAMCLAGGLGGIAGGYVGKNLNGWKKWGVVALGGLVGWIATAMALAKPLNQMEKNVCKDFGAEVIRPNTTEQNSTTIS